MLFFNLGYVVGYHVAPYYTIILCRTLRSNGMYIGEGGRQFSRRKLTSKETRNSCSLGYLGYWSQNQLKMHG